MENFDKALAQYLEAQGRARHERAFRIFGAMTKRERQLIREVAVMAWVRGMRAGGGNVEVPLDSQILIDAVLACLSMEDLYPTVTRLERVAVRRERRARKANT